MSDLTAGWYIRAVVNCHGKHWIEVFNVCGKPFKTPESRESFKIAIKGKYARPMYVSDMGVGNHRSSLTSLFKFSSELHIFLRELEKDGRTFCEFLNPELKDDLKWGEHIQNVEHQNRVDDLCDVMFFN